jgi:hypothetical protein
MCGDMIWIVAISGCRVLLLLCNCPQHDASKLAEWRQIARRLDNWRVNLSREHQHTDTSDARKQQDTPASVLRAIDTTPWS